MSSRRPPEAAVSQQLARAAARAQRRASRAARAAALRCPVAVHHAHDRGSGAVHFAAADDGRRLRELHRLDASAAIGRRLRVLRRHAQGITTPRSASSRFANSSPGSRRPNGDSRSARRSGARACSRRAPIWCSTSCSRRSASIGSKRERRSGTAAAPGRSARSARSRKGCCGSRSSATANISIRCSTRSCPTTGAPRAKSG